VALVVALTYACGAPAPTDVRGGDASPNDLDVLATRALSEHEVPGLAVAVLREDGVVLARGYGHVRAGDAAAVTATTPFQLGSISKQFLAALVVLLAHDGQLSLDDAVVTHLPGFPALRHDVRVRHLLNHTAGVRELFTASEAQAGFDDLSRTQPELVALVRRLPVDHRPGERWAYSNTHYTLLALLVERLTGQPYEEVLASRFFRPLGLTSLRQCPSRPSPPAEADGHERRDGVVVRAAPENMQWIRGDGGLCGHALDVARWTRLLATGRAVPAPAYDAMAAPTRLTDGSTADYGFGLSLVPLDAVRRVAHNGAMRGFSATAAYYPDHRLTVVVLANRGDVRTESIERRMTRHLLDLPLPERREVPLAAEGATRYVGTYDIGVFDVHVRERDGRLWLEMPPPGPTTSLTYVGDHEFVGADPEANRVRFDGGAARSASMRLLMGGMHWYGRRRP